jgi:hypothetical protein
MTNLTIQPTEPAADGAWANVPAGLHQATITSIEQAEASSMYPDDGPRFKIFFALPQFLDEDNKPVVLHGYCSQKLNAKTKLWKWLTQLGYPLQPGGPQFNLAQLVQRPVTITVSIADSENGPRPKVTDLWPPQPGSVVAPVQQVQQPQQVQQQPAAQTDATRCLTCGETDGMKLYATRDGRFFCENHGPRSEI